MQLELADQEIDLLRLLLVKEFEETRVELHHARNMDYKAGLEQREALLRRLTAKFAATA